MASIIIGRARCPECGFEHAHIKRSDKCTYRYCPGCGINGPHARTKQQIDNMTRDMRPVEDARKAAPTTTGEAGSTPAAEPAPPATPTGPSGTAPTTTPPGATGAGVFKGLFA